MRAQGCAISALLSIYRGLMAHFMCLFWRHLQLCRCAAGACCCDKGTAGQDSTPARHAMYPLQQQAPQGTWPSSLCTCRRNSKTKQSIDGPAKCRSAWQEAAGSGSRARQSRGGSEGTCRAGWARGSMRTNHCSRSRGSTISPPLWERGTLTV